MNPIWRSYFSKGLVQPPTRNFGFLSIPLVGVCRLIGVWKNHTVSSRSPAPKSPIFTNVTKRRAKQRREEGLHQPKTIQTCQHASRKRWSSMASHWIFGFILNNMTSCSINDTGCSLTKLPKHRSTTKGHPPRKCYPATTIHQTWCSNRSGISMMYIRQWIEYKGDTHLTIWHPGHTWEVRHFQTHTHTQTMCNVSFMSEADAHDIILARAWNQFYSKDAPRIRQWHKLNINLIFDICLTQTCWIHLDTVLMFDQKIWSEIWHQPDTILWQLYISCKTLWLQVFGTTLMARFLPLPGHRKNLVYSIPERRWICFWTPSTYSLDSHNGYVVRWCGN